MPPVLFCDFAFALVEIRCLAAFQGERAGPEIDRVFAAVVAGGHFHGLGRREIADRELVGDDARAGPELLQRRDQSRIQLRTQVECNDTGIPQVGFENILLLDRDQVSDPMSSFVTPATSSIRSTTSCGVATNSTNRTAGEPPSAALPVAPGVFAGPAAVSLVVTP